MNASNHIDRNRLRDLVSGVLDEQQHEDIIEHVGSCSLCQETIEGLAANPELWEKASQMMSGSKGYATSLRLNLEGDEGRDELTEGYSMQDILDTPSHPEMMGRIGDYDIEREIGRGGMGVVFKAFDTELNRPLAVKVLSPRLAENGTARQRFSREARAAAAVLHPNVVAIYGVNSSHETPYLIMPYVAGPSLQRLVEEHGPLAEKDIVRIGLQVASGLSAAHSQGLVHRDIKPANILVEPDVSRALVTDFGLARALDDVSMTQSGYFVGTPNYMSPEQALGKRVDARSDLFSLGCVFYFMATGHLPFRADSPLCVLNRISNDEPTPVLQVNNEISRTLGEIIGRLMAKDPDHRFQSASELHDVLERFLVYLHQPDAAHPPRIINRPKRRVVNLKIAKRFAALLSVIALLYAGFVSTRHWNNSTAQDIETGQPTMTMETFTEEWNSVLEGQQLTSGLEEVDELAVQIQILEQVLHTTGVDEGEP